MKKQLVSAMPTDLTIIGAGGHGKVVIDALMDMGIENITIADSDVSLAGSYLLEKPICLLEEDIVASSFHVAVGLNDIRSKLYENYKHYKYETIVSSYAKVSRHASILDGVFVAAGAVIGPSSVLGRGVIVNHGAIVDHDCCVEEFCHIAPNATLLGGVSIGKRVLVGSGSVVLPGVVIEDDVIIGAGSVVTKNVKQGMTVAGNPARKM